MKKVLLGLLLIGSPALAQTQLVPRDTVKPAAKGAAARVADVCPIGKTAKGELVYSLKCNDMPAPPAPPSQAEAAPAAAEPRSEPEVRRSGVFGWSYDRRKEAE